VGPARLGKQPPRLEAGRDGGWEPASSPADSYLCEGFHEEKEGHCHLAHSPEGTPNLAHSSDTPHSFVHSLFFFSPEAILAARQTLTIQGMFQDAFPGILPS
jgi:hypothetical protein